MTILIADAGAGKTDWRLIDTQTEEIWQLRGEGISPHYQDQSGIADTLRQDLEGRLAQSPEEIFFYGTGCSSLENRGRVEEALRLVFPRSRLYVEHDMLAAARAVCGSRPGITCILGTGSNACVYDGAQISFQQLNLGFWLGDEGSGAYLGKTLVTAYLHGRVPKELAEKMAKRYELSRDEVIVNAYQKPFPSRYFAGFSKFVFDHLHHPFCYALAYDAFKTFFEKYVCTIPGYESQTVGFVGSVAYYYSDVLLRAARNSGVKTGTVLQHPVAGLSLYHVPGLQG